MKKNKSEIIIVLDRSGSMQSIRNDMESGFKSFLEEQKKVEGECYLSIYQFDGEFETVYEGVSIKDISGLSLSPRGSTALYDAICSAARLAGDRFAKMPEAERPETVIFMTITDGEENASRNNTVLDVKSVIEHQSSKYNWKFTFLGSNQDAVTKGREMGFEGGKSMSFVNSSAAVSNTWKNYSKATTSLRACLDYNYTEQDRRESTDTGQTTSN